nr:uncharacterized protein LOC112708932 [Arachis hypogaea]
MTLFLAIGSGNNCFKKLAGLARKEDIPYIKCQVCEILAKQLHQQVKIKQAEIAPKKISEYEIIKITDNVCNLKKVEVDWILCIDIVEKEDRLELVEHDSEGQCNSKCKTIERACQEVIGYSDANVAEYLYTWKPDADLLYKYFCKDLTKACNTKPPPVLKRENIDRGAKQPHKTKDQEPKRTNANYVASSIELM